MKFLIVGRTSAGKDTLAECLMHRYKWKFVKSYATRERRTPQEDSHIFISHEEATKIPDSEKVARTIHENTSGRKDEYFATRKQVEEADAYIIDPRGIHELLHNMPEETFVILYLTGSEELRRASAIDRASDKETAATNFDTRNATEKAQFDEFEDAFREGTFGGINCPILHLLENPYKEEWIEQMAYETYVLRRSLQKLTDIVCDLTDAKIISQDNNNKCIVHLQNNDTISLTPEQFAAALYSDNEGLSICMLEWLCLPNTHLFNTKRNLSIAETTVSDYICQMADSMHLDMTTHDFERIMDTIANDDTLWSGFQNRVRELLQQELEEH